MRQIQLLFIDPSLQDNTASVDLSNFLKMPCFSIGDFWRQQVKIKDDLVVKIQSLMDKGELPSTDLTTELIRRNIQNIDFADFILSNYPKTLEEYECFLNMLKNNNYHIERIWYFKHGNSLDYFENHYKNHYKNPEHKGWLDKFGDEIRDSWFKATDTYSREMAELHSFTNQIKWHIIEVHYADRLTLSSKIEDCLTPSV
jgi:adenylate kinase family enzyme